MVGEAKNSQDQETW